MIKVKRRRSRVILENYELGDCLQLERMLSVWDYNRFKYRERFFTYMEDQGKLIIPSGVSNSQIYQSLHRSNNECFIIDETNYYTRPKTISFDMQENTDFRNDIQKEAFTFMVDKNKAMKFVSLDVGIGKTYCTIRAIKELAVPTIIIAHNLSDNWLVEIEKFSKLSIGTDVHAIVGTDAVKRMPKMKGSIFILSTASARTAIDRLGVDAFDKIIDDSNIGLKVIDEAHVNFNANIRIDSAMDVEMNIYLTATPERSDYLSNSIYKLVYHDFPSYGGHTIKGKKHYNVHYCSYYTNPSVDDINNFRTFNGFSLNNYCNYLMKNDERYIFYKRLILEYIRQMDKLIPKGTLIVVLINLKVIIQDVFDMLKSDPYYNDLGIGLYCGLVPKKKRFDEIVDNHIILSNMQSSTEGMNFPNIGGLINMSSFSSAVRTRQVIGRLRESDHEVYYFDVHDAAVPDMRRQMNRRRQLLNSIARNVKLMLPIQYNSLK